MKRWLLPLNFALMAALVAAAVATYMAWRRPAEPAAEVVEEANEGRPSEEPAEQPDRVLLGPQAYESVWKSSLFRDTRRFPESADTSDASRTIEAVPRMGLRGIVIDETHGIRKAYFETRDRPTTPSGSTDPRSRAQPEADRKTQAYKVGDEIRPGWRLSEVQEGWVVVSFGGSRRQVFLGKGSDINSLEPLFGAPSQPGPSPAAAGRTVGATPPAPEGAAAAPAVAKAVSTPEQGPGIYLRLEGKTGSPGEASQRRGGPSLGLGGDRQEVASPGVSDRFRIAVRPPGGRTEGAPPEASEGTKSPQAQ